MYKIITSVHANSTSQMMADNDIHDGIEDDVSPLAVGTLTLALVVSAG